MRNRFHLRIVALFICALTACSNLPGNPKQQGAVIGGASGAAVGAAVSPNNRALGAIIGGAVGAAGGYVVGANKDKIFAKDHEGASEAAPDIAAALAAAPTVESIQKSVQASKQVVQLNAKQYSTDQVIISNKMLGAVEVRFVKGPVPPGLKVTLDRTELKGGEQATVAFRFQPGDQAPPKRAQVGLSVEPTNQLIQIGVEFQ